MFDKDTLALDFEDDSLTSNMRCAYPLHYIENASSTSISGTPKNIIMLTCDAFGVLPPISKLSPEQAMYHFLSGFTSKMAGLEKGITETQPTFSTCFGAPFMPRRPEVYEFRLHGACIGAGIELPAFAGRVVAAPDSSFRLPEVGMGLIPGAGGCVSLPRRVGRQRFNRMAMTGEALSAGEALRMGLIDAIEAV